MTGLHALAAWRRQRLSHGVFGAAALVVALASVVGQDLTPWAALRVVIAWLMLACTRLWDDFEDRVIDRDAHPDRVDLAPHAPLVIGLVLLGVSLVSLTTPWFLLLAAALFAFYRLRPSPMEAMLVLKYPAFVGLSRGSVDAESGAAMLLILGAMLLDSDLLRIGAVVYGLAILAMVVLAPFPIGLLLLAGLGVPLLLQRLGRRGALVGIVVLLSAFHLVIS